MNRILYLVDLGVVPYADAWQLQKQIVEEKRSSPFPDVVLLVEHPPVVTIGRGGKQDNLLVSLDELGRKGIDFFRVERGGDVTYHEPGNPVRGVSIHAHSSFWDFAIIGSSDPA